MSSVRVIREQSGSVENKNLIPSVIIQDNKVYVGGVHVFREQLSAGELREYFPEEYHEVYKGDVFCPKCDKLMTHADGNSLRGHCRMAHREWYIEHKAIFDEFKVRKDGFKDLLIALRGVLEKKEEVEA